MRSKILTPRATLFCSLIDRRGFLPSDDTPPTVTSDADLPSFMAKNDPNMVRTPPAGLHGKGV